MINISEFISELRSRKTILIAAAAFILFAAAAFFFYLKGENDTISLSEAESSSAESTVSGGTSGGAKVYVDVSGCVKKPGVYEVDPGSRIFQVIEKAGGTTDEADTSMINQAEQVSDGLKVVVPDKESAAVTGTDTSSSGAAPMQSGGKININSADSAALQEIPGIGPVTAEKIISYRAENGSFKTVEDIRNVSGIGEKTFEKIKPLITV